MNIGIVKERKNHENRVGITPSGAKTLIENGHTVFFETGTGEGSGFLNQEYFSAGAIMQSSAEEIYKGCHLIVKVKEPVKEEYPWIQKNQMIFTFLHLAALPELNTALKRSGCIAFAYEMVMESNGTLPLLMPMSEVAGRMSIQIAARLMEKTMGGPGIMMSGVPGVAPAEVVIIGGGIVGSNAAKMAHGSGARVTIIDSNPMRLRQLDDLFGGRITTLTSNSFNLSTSIQKADVVIGAVLIPGKKAPKIVTKEMVSVMRPGSVIIDVAIDQGGCIETIDRFTSHSEPTYLVNEVIHYAVPNIPGIVPRTSTLALTNATLPYVMELANKGWEAVMQEETSLARSASIMQGSQIH